MEFNRGLSALAGILIGACLGAVFYIMPAKFLICGPIPSSGIFLPPGVQGFVLSETFRYGVISGMIIGFLSGLSSTAPLPRGHLSRSIGGVCWLVETILAWATQYHWLAETSGGRILIIVLISFFSMFLVLPFSYTLSFIEKIRE